MPVLGLQIQDMGAEVDFAQAERELRLVEELVDGVEDLKTTFKGNGAVSYQNFMAESQRVQQDLIKALSGISKGQAESAKHYVQMDDAFEAGGKEAEGQASGAKTSGFSFSK